MGYKSKQWDNNREEAPFFILEKGIYSNLNVASMGYVLSQQPDPRFDNKTMRYTVQLGPVVEGKTPDHYKIFDVACLDSVKISEEEIASGRCVVMVAFLDTNPNNFYRNISSPNEKVVDRISTDSGVRNILHDYRNAVIIGKLEKGLEAEAEVDQAVEDLVKRLSTAEEHIRLIVRPSMAIPEVDGNLTDSMHSLWGWRNFINRIEAWQYNSATNVGSTQLPTGDISIRNPWARGAMLINANFVGHAIREGLGITATAPTIVHTEIRDRLLELRNNANSIVVENEVLTKKVSELEGKVALLSEFYEKHIKEANSETKKRNLG